MEIFKIDDFEKDNAFLLSKFEILIGLVEQTKASCKSLEKELIGENHKNEVLQNQINTLIKNIGLLRFENSHLKEKLEKEHRIIPQNFNIRNKIIKIVSDIEDKESKSEELKNIVEILIKEIEYCINQLEK